jgi:hypothetical protein
MSDDSIGLSVWGELVELERALDGIRMLAEQALHEGLFREEDDQGAPLAVLACTRPSTARWTPG